VADLGGKGYLWPDADGTAKVLTTAFVAATTTPYLTISGHLLIKLVVAGYSPVAVEIKAEVSFDGESWIEWQAKVVPGASIGTHYATLSLPDHAQVRLSAKRWGGSTSTTLQVYAYARRDLGVPGRSGQPIELRAAAEDGVLCWRSSTAAVALSTSAYAGDWVPVGEATEAIFRGTVSEASSITAVNVRVDWSPDGGTTVVPYEAVNGAPSSGSVDHDDGANVGPGGTGEHMRRLPTHPGSAIRAACSRTAGVGSLIGRIYLYVPGA